MGIPALLAAGVYEAVGSRHDVAAVGGPGWVPTLVATGVSFVVALAAIAWLLKLVARHPISVFIWWRLIVAAFLATLLLTGVMSPTGAFPLNLVDNWWVWIALGGTVLAIAIVMLFATQRGVGHDGETPIGGTERTSSTHRFWANH
jgi:drug/metabolite transporter (DMT)-like permease